MATATACLRDGRSLTFAAAGPRDGFPVIYCHGAIGSPRWRTPVLEELTERLGLRYLMVNRPGFGGSDPCPGRQVADFAGDVRELMDLLGARRFSVVGVSAGAPYALACGWGMPDRVEAVAAVSPLSPAASLGARQSLRYHFTSWSLGRRPGLAGLCLRALRLHGETAPEAMLLDYAVCRADWGFDPAEVRVPVTLWHGRGDRLVPLAHTRRLAAAIPRCTPVVVPTGGHFFYSRRLEQIVGALAPEVAAPALAA